MGFLPDYTKNNKQKLPTQALSIYSSFFFD